MLGSRGSVAHSEAVFKRIYRAATFPQLTESPHDVGAPGSDDMFKAEESVVVGIREGPEAPGETPSAGGHPTPKTGSLHA